MNADAGFGADINHLALDFVKVTVDDKIESPAVIFYKIQSLRLFHLHEQ